MGGGVCSATLGGGVCSTSLSLGGGMCSTPLSSGLLQSHVSSLSLPSVNAVTNTQVTRKVSQLQQRQNETFLMWLLLFPNIELMRLIIY